MPGLLRQRLGVRCQGPGQVISQTMGIMGMPNPLDFRTYAATFSQARRRMLISCGVTGSGSAWRYCVAMMTRRSLASMSRTDGWVLVRYHGASSRAASTSVGWWPVVAYQQTVRLLMTSANGVV